jgi:hypothetical protein
MSATPQSAYHLIRGDTILGTITPNAAQDNFPWYGGNFEPTPEFERIRPFLDHELRLLDADRMEEWDVVWNEIEKPGLRLEPMRAGSPIIDLLIHIDGATTWWRS